MRKPEWWETQGEEWKFQNPEPSFKPGDKVVCIKSLRDAVAWGDRHVAQASTLIVYPRLLLYGEVYVVREVRDDAVRLVGVLVGKKCDPEEWWIKQENFILLSEYREERARIRNEGFWERAKKMEAYEREMNRYKDDGTLKAPRGRKGKGG